MATSAALAALGDRLLPAAKLFDCFGTSLPDLSQSNVRRFALVSDFSRLAIEAVKDDMAQDGETAAWSVLGVDLVRGRPQGGTSYKRPVAEDAKDPEVLADKAHTYIPLKKDGAEVRSLDNETRVPIEAGQLFLAKLGIEHFVHVPAESMIVEFTLVQDVEDVNATWERYCHNQPNPTIA
jgi:hypothetical protein